MFYFKKVKQVCDFCIPESDPVVISDDVIGSELLLKKCSGCLGTSVYSYISPCNLIATTVSLSSFFFTLEWIF